MSAKTENSPAAVTRERILKAAAELLARDGREGLSTRAVSAAAGVQPPALYRLFGDKDGLLDAVAAYGFEQYLADKRAMGWTDDPVADLRRGWDLHIEFGLSHPEFYALMYGDPARSASASAEAEAILRTIVTRIADTGRLRMSVDRAVRLVHATGMGVVLSLIAVPVQERDLELPNITRESIFGRILSGEPSGAGAGLPGRAAALRAMLGEASMLSDAERGLLGEWLDRIADA